MSEDDDDREVHDAEDRAEDASLLDRPDEQRTIDAGSRRVYKNRQRDQKEFEKRRLAFWQGVFADPVGRAEMWRLLALECHSFEERFVCSPTGVPYPEGAWFAAGQQALGLRLYQEFLVRDAAGVMLMHAEHDPRFQVKK